VDKVNLAFAQLEIPYLLRVEWLQARETEDALGDVAVAVLTDNRTGVVVSPADVGFGLSQILPVVVQLVGNENKTILVEQPEIHLHPKMQSRIADVMLTSIAENKNRLLIETHSEHILLRAQRRLRESQNTVEADARQSLAVYYVRSSGKAGEVFSLRVDSSGRVVDPWPDGFFDERLEDILVGG
jgi:predicted ATPase